MYQLSRKDPKVLESMSDEQLSAMPDVIEGDGKAEFFGEGTEADYKEFEREQSGMKGWYDRLKKL